MIFFVDSYWLDFTFKRMPRYRSFDCILDESSLGSFAGAPSSTDSMRLLGISNYSYSRLVVYFNKQYRTYNWELTLIVCTSKRGDPMFVLTEFHENEARQSSFMSNVSLRLGYDARNRNLHYVTRTLCINMSFNIGHEMIMASAKPLTVSV
jgi:hypothetical protein